MVKKIYKVLARFQPFDSQEEFITIKPKESLFEETLTFCVNDKSIHIDKDIQEGDEVLIEKITFIKKVH